MARTKNVSEWLDASAARFPNKIAFSDGKISLTFWELCDKARRIGSELARRGLFKQPVLVKLDKEPRAIAAFLGAAYSGNFYVPVEIDTPKERLQKIIDKCEPALIINYDNFDELSSSEIDEGLLSNAAKRQIDTDLLLILFTSGSTGTPKGVAIHQRGVIDYSERVRETFGYNENTIHGQAIPLIFDSSMMPIYQTIMNGGTTYFIPKTTLMFAAKTIDFLNEHKCDSIYWVCTSYNIIAKSGIFEKRNPEYLKRCWFMGEVMPFNVLKTWREALPNAQFANLLGPTEVTDACVYYVVDRDFDGSEPIPIGIPYPNVEPLIFNENNELCKAGEEGELCFRGSKISYGYYNDFERTEKSFVQNPLNKSYPELICRTGDYAYWNDRGEIVLVGRRDFMIKHSGHRIELGEIEAAAGSVNGVELCACVYDDNAKQIVLFYQGKVEPVLIKDELKCKLQPYMVPGRIDQIDSMPRTATGKISRIDLKAKL